MRYRDIFSYTSHVYQRVIETPTVDYCGATLVGNVGIDMVTAGSARYRARMQQVACGSRDYSSAGSASSSSILVGALPDF